jgi:4-hydroxymandelate oxidase
MDLRVVERLARERLGSRALHLIEDAAGEGISARRNEAAFRERWVVPRVLRDVSAVDTTTELLGAHVSAPIGIAPLPRMGDVHEEGEQAVAAAAADLGVVTCAPTNSSVALEDVCLDPERSWFQLYPHGDAGITADLVRRAVEAGYAAVVLTVDRPVPGMKASEATKSTAGGDLPNLARYGPDALGARHRPAFTWTDLDELRSVCPVPVVVKGILSAADAALAVEHGCAAVWVSNHGGRQLDQAVAPLDVLEEIGAAVDGRAQVYLDGGVRRGIDVLIALALGADAVFVGRPIAWGLAAQGQEGVRGVLARLVGELRATMALAGAARIPDVARALVRSPRLLRGALEDG